MISFQKEPQLLRTGPGAAGASAAASAAPSVGLTHGKRLEQEEEAVVEAAKWDLLLRCV